MLVNFAKTFWRKCNLIAVGCVVFIINLQRKWIYAFEQYLISDTVFELKDGVLRIDDLTFLMMNRLESCMMINHEERFITRRFPNVVIILGSGKELYFYKGIQGKNFIYEGRFSFYDEFRYNAIKEYIG